MGRETSSFNTERKRKRELGDLVRRAIVEVADVLGGEDLVDELSPAVYDRTTLSPDHAILIFEEVLPDANVREIVADRAVELAKRVNRENFIRKVTLRKPVSTEDILQRPLPSEAAELPTRIFTKRKR